MRHIIKGTLIVLALSGAPMVASAPAQSPESTPAAAEPAFAPFAGDPVFRRAAGFAVR